jgi:preprotein translocase subunit SecD
MPYLSRWRLTLVFGVCFIGLWLGLANFLSSETLNSLPSFFPKDQVTLGLDLQGGSSVLLEVDTRNVFKDYMTSLLDEVRRIFRQEKILYMNLRLEGGTVLRVTPRNPDQVEKISKILRNLTEGAQVSSTSNGEISMKLNDATIKEREDGAVKQSIEIVRRRIDEMGTKEPSIQQQGNSRILLQLPGVSDPAQVKDLLGKTAKLSFRLVHPTLMPHDPKTKSAPLGYDVLQYDENDDRAGGHAYFVQKKTDISGEMLEDAKATVSEGQDVVSFKLDAVGARKFADITKNNIGRQFAIILDNKIICAPVINTPIPGGSGIIQGNFNLKSARNLAILLRAGALPAPLTPLEERTVGPELGSDSIQAGKLATLISIGFVLIFMFVFYGFLFGGIANICLIMNGVFLISALTFFGATLTLPGIAGIALSLGMAIDANILIYERVREEIRNKQAPMNAIGEGYSRAMSTILDSNITSIIGAVLLYIFGTGAVRGFAVNLGLGIIISFFTAIVLSKVLVLLWMRGWGRNKPLPI